MTIPSPLLREILADKYYEQCVRHKEKKCQGRVTFEHAWIYAGKQIQEKWAIIPLCAYHHGVNEFQDRGNLEKEIGQYHSIRRATGEDFALYPRKDWYQIRDYLTEKYGKVT